MDRRTARSFTETADCLDDLNFETSNANVMVLGIENRAIVSCNSKMTQSDRSATMTFFSNARLQALCRDKTIGTIPKKQQTLAELTSLCEITCHHARH